MITMTYQPQSGPPISIRVKGPEYQGSGDDVSRRQTIGKTRGNQVYVYDQGREDREMTLHFMCLDETERGDIERFFGPDLVNLARRWFKIEVPPVKKIPLRFGASVGGIPVRFGVGALGMGAPFKAGEWVLQDKITYPVRLITPALNFTDSQDTDGWFELTLGVRVLGGNLPDNFC